MSDNSPPFSNIPIGDQEPPVVKNKPLQNPVNAVPAKKSTFIEGNSAKSKSGNIKSKPGFGDTTGASQFEFGQGPGQQDFVGDAPMSKMYMDDALALAPGSDSGSLLMHDQNSPLINNDESIGNQLGGPQPEFDTTPAPLPISQAAPSLIALLEFKPPGLEGDPDYASPASFASNEFGFKQPVKDLIDLRWKQSIARIDAAAISLDAIKGYVPNLWGPLEEKYKFIHGQLHPNLWSLATLCRNITNIKKMFDIRSQLYQIPDNSYNHKFTIKYVNDPEDTAIMGWTDSSDYSSSTSGTPFRLKNRQIQNANLFDFFTSTCGYDFPLPGTGVFSGSKIYITILLELRRMLEVGSWNYLSNMTAGALIKRYDDSPWIIPDESFPHPVLELRDFGSSATWTVGDQAVHWPGPFAIFNIGNPTSTPNFGLGDIQASEAYFSFGSKLAQYATMIGKELSVSAGLGFLSPAGPNDTGYDISSHLNLDKDNANIRDIFKDIIGPVNLGDALYQVNSLNGNGISTMYAADSKDIMASAVNNTGDASRPSAFIHLELNGPKKFMKGDFDVALPFEGPDFTAGGNLAEKTRASSGGDAFFDTLTNPAEDATLFQTTRLSSTYAERLRTSIGNASETSRHLLDMVSYINGPSDAPTPQEVTFSSTWTNKTHQISVYAKVLEAISMNILPYAVNKNIIDPAEFLDAPGTIYDVHQVNTQGGGPGGQGPFHQSVGLFQFQFAQDQDVYLALQLETFATAYKQADNNDLELKETLFKYLLLRRDWRIRQVASATMSEDLIPKFGESELAFAGDTDQSAGQYTVNGAPATEGQLAGPFIDEVPDVYIPTWRLIPNAGVPFENPSYKTYSYVDPNNGKIYPGSNIPFPSTEPIGQKVIDKGSVDESVLNANISAYYLNQFGTFKWSLTPQEMSNGLPVNPWIDMPDGSWDTLEKGYRSNVISQPLAYYNKLKIGTMLNQLIYGPHANSPPADGATTASAINQNILDVIINCCLELQYSAATGASNNKTPPNNNGGHEWWKKTVGSPTGDVLLSAIASQGPVNIPSSTKAPARVTRWHGLTENSLMFLVFNMFFDILGKFPVVTSTDEFTGTPYAPVDSQIGGWTWGSGTSSSKFKILGDAGLNPHFEHDNASGDNVEPDPNDRLLWINFELARQFALYIDHVRLFADGYGYPNPALFKFSESQNYIGVNENGYQNQLPLNIPMWEIDKLVDVAKDYATVTALETAVTRGWTELFSPMEIMQEEVDRINIGFSFLEEYSHRLQIQTKINETFIKTSKVLSSQSSYYDLRLQSNPLASTRAILNGLTREQIFTQIARNRTNFDYSFNEFGSPASDSRHLLNQNDITNREKAAATQFKGGLGQSQYALQMLYKQKQFQAGSASNMKVMVVGIPNGLIEKLRDKADVYSKGALDQGLTIYNPDAFHSTMIVIKVHRKSIIYDDVIFKPLTFVFDAGIYLSYDWADNLINGLDQANVKFTRYDFEGAVGAPVLSVVPQNFKPFSRYQSTGQTIIDGLGYAGMPSTIQSYAAISGHSSSTQVKKDAIENMLRNHMLDKLLRIYYRTGFGLNFNEDVFLPDGFRGLNDIWLDKESVNLFASYQSTSPDSKHLQTGLLNIGNLIGPGLNGNTPGIPQELAGAGFFRVNSAGELINPINNGSITEDQLRMFRLISNSPIFSARVYRLKTLLSNLFERTFMIPVDIDAWIVDDELTPPQTIETLSNVGVIAENQQGELKLTLQGINAGATFAPSQETVAFDQYFCHIELI